MLTPPKRTIMLRIAFLIGLISTAFSLTLTANPLPQTAKNKKKTDDNYANIAKKLITRYDANDDKQLSKQEWEKMLLSPAKADANQDQQITIEEYANWARSKDRAGKTKATPTKQAKPQTTPKKPAQNQNTKPQQKTAEQDKDASRVLSQQREQQLINQIERQLEQREMEERERREGEQNRQREMEQRERPEGEQNRRREMEERERREGEQNRQREMEQRDRREGEHHAPRDGNEHWEIEFRKLEEARTLLHQERDEASRKFGDDHPRRIAIQAELNELEGAMKQLFHQRGKHEDRPHDQGDHAHGDHELRDHEHRDHEHRDHEHGDHDQGDHEHRDHNPGNHDQQAHQRRDHDHKDNMPTEQRLELLRVAFDHLNEAGMHDLAEETKRRGEELEQQLRRENDHGNDQIANLIEESHRAIHAVNQRLDQVQRELQEMREQFNRLRNQP
ncbi:MAG: hypothetical protein CMM07_30075 [Rhodopirellula sp.]|nr:hypothetical protein [Rhodopirellula sp.]